jgi:O-6-methylguanine DNA methyltransferase
MMNTIYYKSFECLIGQLTVAWTPKGICRLLLPGDGLDSLDAWAAKHIKEYRLTAYCDQYEGITQLMQYFQGKRHYFDCPLDIYGTEFSKKVWKIVSAVAYGTTATYKDVAVALGSPPACRAVGNANKRNPVPIIIPCHRIIGRDSTLTGYSGGIHLKRVLLDLEKLYTYNEIS